MRKRLVAILVLFVAFCWTTVAMADIAVVAPKTVNESMLGEWRYDLIPADVHSFEIWQNGKTFVAESKIYDSSVGPYLGTILQYDKNGNYYACRYILEFDDSSLYIEYQGLSPAIASYKVDTHDTGFYDKTYIWNAQTNQWYDHLNLADVPPISIEDYFLTFTWVDDNNSPPSLPTLKQADDDKFYYYGSNGEIDTTYNDPAFEFEGGKFIVVEGRVATEISGLQTMYGTEFYFYAYGQVQEVTRLVEYGGKWFVVEKGKFNPNFTGLYDYDGSHFLVTDGWLRDDYTGPWTENGVTYQITEGQVL